MRGTGTTDLIERMIEAPDAGSFGAALLARVNQLCGAQEVFAHVLQASGPPRPVVFDSYSDTAGERVQTYTQGYYQLDPSLSRLCGDAVPGNIAYTLIHADEIRDTDYRQICYDRPRFARKLSIGRQSDGAWAILNVYLPGGEGMPEPVAWANLAAVAMPLISRLSAASSARLLPFHQRLEARLSVAFPKLTRRESEVIARTIAGFSAEGIGHDLGIAPSSVQTYRRRGYDKYQRTSANEFLPAIMFD